MHRFINPTVKDGSGVLTSEIRITSMLVTLKLGSSKRYKDLVERSDLQQNAVYTRFHDTQSTVCTTEVLNLTRGRLD
jgi:hypothetical protein